MPRRQRGHRTVVTDVADTARSRRTANRADRHLSVGTVCSVRQQLSAYCDEAKPYDERDDTLKPNAPGVIGLRGDC
ncbi:MAG TPA: hypothetical protein VGR22_06050 [Thermomicrobiales bacterium]|nr:hypothetical protein [Thermomicrobiales bacterium]